MRTGPALVVIEFTVMIRFILLIVSFTAFLGGVVSAQTQAAGAKASIGKVFAGGGRSAAAKDLQSKLNGGLLKTAVAKSRSVKARPNSRTTTRRSPSAVPAPPQPSYTDFRPSNNSDFVERFASAISSNPTEKELIKQVVTTTRTAFEQEVAKEGRPNNLAAAFTFFVASTVTVYHNDPEPSDKAVNELWDGLNETINSLPEMEKLTDAEKQEVYEMLVAFGGLVLAGHMLANESGDADAGRIYPQLAGELIRTVLQLDPEKIRFNSAGLNVAA